MDDLKYFVFVVALGCILGNLFIINAKLSGITQILIAK